LVLAVACAFPVAGVAAELPIKPGTTYCGDAFIITADGVGGEDFNCTARSIASPEGVVVLDCIDESGQSEPWSVLVTIVENANGTLTYSGDGETLMLGQCE
jgi:hypothetical protein